MFVITQGYGGSFTITQGYGDATAPVVYTTPLLGLFGIEPKYLSECIISPKQVADVGIETTVQAGTVN